MLDIIWGETYNPDRTPVSSRNFPTRHWNTGGNLMQADEMNGGQTVGLARRQLFIASISNNIQCKLVLRLPIRVNDRVNRKYGKIHDLMFRSWDYENHWFALLAPVLSWSIRVLLYFALNGSHLETRNFGLPWCKHYAVVCLKSRALNSPSQF